MLSLNKRGVVINTGNYTPEIQFVAEINGVLVGRTAKLARGIHATIATGQSNLAAQLLETDSRLAELLQLCKNQSLEVSSRCATPGGQI